MTRARTLIPLLAAALLTLALSLSLAVAAPPADAAKGPRCTQRARRGRRGRACAPRSGTRRAERGSFGRVDGIEYEFEDVQISGTLTASEPAGGPSDGDYSFRALNSAIIRPKKRYERRFFRRELTEVGGRFLLHGDMVFAMAHPVDYRITSSATYTDSDGDQTDCSYNRPTGVDRLGMQIWSQRDRIAVRWSLFAGGWGCRHEVTGYPSCGNATGGDASVMFYKEIEFTRRWIRLPIDLQWRTSDTVNCEFRWNGYVKLKKLRDGK